ncbi:MAG TPA: YfiR family protein [Methylophilaceae bacterium]|jgi:hypothetical protein
MGILTSILQPTVLRWLVQKCTTCLVSRGAVTLVAISAMVLLHCKAVVAEDSIEYGVKAAFLYKFGSYVEWPAAAFSSATSPFNLCLVGGDSQFGSTLDKVVGSNRINGRSVVIRRLKTAEKDSGCHILYIDGSEAQHSAQIIEVVRGSSVLTVGNAGGTGSAIIDFVIVDNRVRFDIDDEAAAQKGLVISSKLMSLALNVRRRTTQGSQ